MENPQATAVGIGNQMEISDRMVRKHIALLRKANIICRHGSNKSRSLGVAYDAIKLFGADNYNL